MHHRTLFAALTALACTAAPLSAQTYALQGSGLMLGFQGKDYEDVEKGYGGEVQLRQNSGLWSYGVGGQFTTHKTPDNLGGAKINIIGAFIEPRRLLGAVGGSFTPYISLRVGVLRQSISVDENLLQRQLGGANPDVLLRAQRRANVKIQASGLQGNAGGGVLLRLSPSIQLDLGGSYGIAQFGNAKASFNGQNQTLPESKTSGQNFVARAGLSFGFGGGGSAKPAAAPPAEAAPAPAPTPRATPASTPAATPATTPATPAPTTRGARPATTTRGGTTPAATPAPAPPAPVTPATTRGTTTKPVAKPAKPAE